MKTSKASNARKGKVRLGWRKRRAAALKYELKRLELLKAAGVEA